MNIQLTRHNSKTHLLWREGRTVSIQLKAQLKDSQSVVRRQDSEQGWKFSSQGTIQRLTIYGKNPGQSAGMDIQLTRHNPKTHLLWREGRTVSRDRPSDHKAQFKDSPSAERRQDSWQGDIQLKAEFNDSLAVVRIHNSQQGWTFSSKAQFKGSQAMERRQESQQGQIFNSRHNSKTHLL
jgi:hypothetical protein